MPAPISYTTFKGMTSVEQIPTTPVSHVVAMAYPGGGHIIPLMHFCKSLVSISNHVLVTFVVTEDGVAFNGSEPTHHRIRLAYLPNPLSWKPSGPEDFCRYIEALTTNVEAPFEQLLDRLDPPPRLIIADTLLVWASSLGSRKKIPVASFWTTSAANFSAFLHFPLLEQNGHFPVDLSEKGDEKVDYIPGLSARRFSDLDHVFEGFYDYVLPKIPGAFSLGPKVQYLILSSMYELEQPVIDALKAELSIPVYCTARENSKPDDCDGTGTDNNPDYLQWLDDRPESSVLYVSLGVLAPIPPAQIDEVMAGLRESEVSYIMVGRWDSEKLKEVCGDRGMVVPYCDQVRVLSHKSVGGFWSHCGWNSTMEGVLAGVPFLAFPLFGDQFMNSKYVVEDWKTGWRIKKTEAQIITRGEIAGIVRRLMESDDDETKKVRERAKELQRKVLGSFGKDGSLENDLNSFIKDFLSHSQVICTC